MPENNDLSEREIEILRLVATGASNKEIARKLYISTNTVKVHLRNIFAKISVASRTEAAMYAVKVGLVERLGTSLESTKLPETGIDQQLVKGASGLASGVSEFTNRKAREKSILLIHSRWVWISSFILLIILITLAVILSRPFTRNQEIVSSISTPVSRWQIYPKLPTSRFGLAVVAYEDQIFAIGGESSNGVIGVVESFDINGNKWSVRHTKPTPVADISAVVIGAKIYIPGGRLDTGEVTDRLEIYDPNLDTWSQGARMPIAVSAYGLTAFEGKLYLFGGWDGQKYLDNVLEYDPDLDRWEARAGMPHPRGFVGAAVSGGKIFIVGGYDGWRALSLNEAYSPDRDNKGDYPWEQKTPLPEGRYAMGVASIADLISVVGGEGKKPLEFNSLFYVPQSDEWQSFENPPKEGISNFGLTALGTYLYLVGGKQGLYPINDTYGYKAIYTVAIPVIRK